TFNQYLVGFKNCIYGRITNLESDIYIEWGSSITQAKIYNLMFYPITYTKTLSQKTTQKSFNGSEELSQVTDFSYDDYSQLKEQVTSDSKGNILKTVYKYPYDGTGYDNNLLANSGIIAPVIEKQNFVNQTHTSSQRTVYKVLGVSGSPYIPNVYSKEGIYTRKDSIDDYVEEINFTRFGSIASVNAFKLFEYQTNEGLITSLLWCCGCQYPIAKIENASCSEVAQS